MFRSEFFDDSFSGSGFSYYDECNDDYSDADEAFDNDDESLRDFENDAMYDEAFDNYSLDTDDICEDDFNPGKEFNDGFDEL